jgi:glycosyltransferase involved in cell wall biosynthesis
MKKNILFKGPLLTRSGYGEQSRFALRALRERSDLFNIYVQPLQWGKTSWISEEDPERMWIDQAIEKTIAFIQSGATFDASFQVTIPNEWEKLAPVNIGFTAGIETTKVAYPWIQKGNEMDRIVVVSNHSKKVYNETVYIGTHPETGVEVQAKLETPVDTVNYPVKTFEPIDLDLDLKHNVNFLCVAQYGPRKNLENTVRWFIEEFRSEEVGLVVKSNITKNSIGDRKQMFFKLAQLVRSMGEKKCTVHLLHGDMTDQEMHSLYTHDKIHCLASLSHGEGFGLPIFEAAYSGLPVITTAWSGQNDFLFAADNKAHEFYIVEHDLAPIPEAVIWDGVLIKESEWCYPREHSVRSKFREFYSEYSLNPKKVEKRFKKDAKRIKETFSPERQNALMVESVCAALNIDPSQSLDDTVMLEFG